MLRWMYPTVYFSYAPTFFTCSLCLTWFFFLVSYIYLNYAFHFYLVRKLTTLIGTMIQQQRYLWTSHMPSISYRGSSTGIMIGGKDNLQLFSDMGNDNCIVKWGRTGKGRRGNKTWMREKVCELDIWRALEIYYRIGAERGIFTKCRPSEVQVKQLRCERANKKNKNLNMKYNVL